MMPREMEDQRTQIALLRERFPEKDVYNIKDVMSITGKQRGYVKRHLMYDCKTICIAKLANRLCKL